MPYKSEAQRRFFNAAAAKGKIEPAVVREFNEASKGLDLPQRVHNTKKDRHGNEVNYHHRGK